MQRALGSAGKLSIEARKRRQFSLPSLEEAQSLLKSPGEPCATKSNGGEQSEETVLDWRDALAAAKAVAPESLRDQALTDSFGSVFIFIAECLFHQRSHSTPRLYQADNRLRKDSPVTILIRTKISRVLCYCLGSRVRIQNTYL